MAQKQIELVFDLSTRQIEGESTGYQGMSCDADLTPLLRALGVGVKRKRKERLQVRDTKTMQHC